MITAWQRGDKGLVKSDAPQPPREAVWLDVAEPTPEDRASIEECLGFELPTRSEMQQIEPSSRLYREDGAVFMTALMLIKTETEHPEPTAVTFILTRDRLVTLRFAEPWSFRTFAQRAPKSGVQSADQAFATLLDVTVERLADLMEIVQLELEHLQQRIFRRRRDAMKQTELKHALQKLGACGGILGKVRESLVDKNRVAAYCEQQCNDWLPAEARAHLHAIRGDIQSLGDQASFIAGKVQFLLDAVLGLINVQVNYSMRMLGFITVAVMWPTLVSGFFAMNVRLPFPHEGSMWPFWLCVLLAFGPVIAGGGWWWWNNRRAR